MPRDTKLNLKYERAKYECPADLLKHQFPVQYNGTLSPIPDLWHPAMYLQDRITNSRSIDESRQAKHYAEMVLDAWHIAHDQHKVIAELRDQVDSLVEQRDTKANLGVPGNHFLLYT